MGRILGFTRIFSSLFLLTVFMAGSVSALAENQSDSNMKPRSSIFSGQMGIENNNPFLNLIRRFETENDHGPTHGVNLEVALLSPQGYFSDNERWTARLQTNLYTEDLTPPGQVIFPNPPQKFNEISTLTLTWDDLFNKINSKDLYYVVGAGVGLMNNCNENGFLAIGQQTAWHEYKHNHLTPEITPMYANQLGDTCDYFPTAKFALGKVIAFNDAMQNCGCEIDRIKTETGVEYIGMRKGSQMYLLMSVNKKMLSVLRTRIGVEAKIKGTLYQTGDSMLTNYFGIEIGRPHFSVTTGMTYINGHQNKHFVQYVDDNRDNRYWEFALVSRWGGSGKRAKKN